MYLDLGNGKREVPHEITPTPTSFFGLQVRHRDYQLCVVLIHTRQNSSAFVNMSHVIRKANHLLNSLHAGKGPSFGAWQVRYSRPTLRAQKHTHHVLQMLPGTNLSRAIARAGFDWICVDCEHGNIADHEMHESVAAIASCGVSPIVRIPANESWMVKRALDSGAHGIIVPLLYSAEDARILVQSAKFPPKGKRGFGSPFSMGTFDSKGNISGLEYLQAANQSLVTCVQIETQEALNEVCSSENNRCRIYALSTNLKRSKRLPT